MCLSSEEGVGVESSGCGGVVGCGDLMIGED
jgi:hypothetical protein